MIVEDLIKLAESYDMSLQDYISCFGIPSSNYTVRYSAAPVEVTEKKIKGISFTNTGAATGYLWNYADSSYSEIKEGETISFNSGFIDKFKLDPTGTEILVAYTIVDIQVNP